MNWKLAEKVRETLCFEIKEFFGNHDGGYTVTLCFEIKEKNKFSVDEQYLTQGEYCSFL